AYDKDFVIHTPLMWLNKAETWKLSDEFEVLDYIRTKTLTCYNGIIVYGCGECPACHLRQRGLYQYLESKGAL
uniref:7-cyano-7-deazaguanine synthase n=1 Tax=Staphylococcus aureus TaxID=1280 RepID=UPI00210D1E98